MALIVEHFGGYNLGILDCFDGLVWTLTSNFEEDFLKAEIVNFWIIAVEAVMGDFSSNQGFLMNVWGLIFF